MPYAPYPTLAFAYFLGLASPDYISNVSLSTFMHGENTKISTTGSHAQHATLIDLPSSNKRNEDTYGTAVTMARWVEYGRFVSRMTLAALRPSHPRALARSYNVVALPLAAGLLKPMFGLGVTPALAALFMASSSSLVVLSSLGLKLYARPGEPTARELAVSAAGKNNDG